MNLRRTSLACAAFVGLLAVFGCSNASSGSDDTEEGALRNDAPAAQSAGFSVETLAIHDSKPAQTVESEDMKSCDTDIEYLQVSGSPNDAKINALLKKGNAAPATCETAESLDMRATVKFAGRGFLSVMEAGSGYSAGAAHPWTGVVYKNIDVTTGEAVTLDKILAPAAKDTILRSIRAQIGVQKQETAGADGRPVIAKLDADLKSALLEAANSAFGQGLAKMTDYAIAPTGIRFDLSNQLPHVLAGLDSEYLVRWKTLDAQLTPAAKQRLTTGR